MRSTLLYPVFLVVTSLASYAPSRSACPPGAEAKVRLAGSPFNGNQSLNPLESSYITQRRQTKIPAAIKAFLGDRAKKVFGADLDKVAPLDLPVIGITLAGGGLRASIVTAGFLKAFDAREEASTERGIGGLLQSASYLTGLSGGSWSLSSFIFGGAPRIDALVFGDGATQTGWGLSLGIFPTDPTAGRTFLSQTLGELSLKLGAGFNVSFIDLWGRAVGRHFLPGTTPENYLDPLAADGHGVDITYSSIVSLPLFKSFDLPLPIITAKAYTVSTKETPPLGPGLASLSTVTYETTPFEFGSFDPELSAFYPTRLLGTLLSAGSPTSPVCVSGYDKASFVFGASSALFNAFNVSGYPDWANPNASLGQSWRLVNSTFYASQPTQQIDIAPLPNPFLGVAADTYEDSAQTQLRLADGALDGLGDPLSPLIVEARAVDVIVVIGAGADSSAPNGGDNKPSGLSLVLTQVRASIIGQGATVLPPLPKSPATFIAQGLNKRPTFFGCNAAPSKLAGKAVESAYPFIVYIPNADPTGTTNTTTVQSIYPDTQTRAMIDASVNIVYSGFPLPNSDSDPEWGTALGCAVMERTRAKIAVDRTEICERLFARYCWNELEGPIVTPPVSSTIIPTPTATISVTPTSTSTCEEPTATTSPNLQLFKGALGGIAAPAIYRNADRFSFRVEGSSLKYFILKIARTRSCSIQEGLCDESAKKSGSSFNKWDCEKQQWKCNAAAHDW